MQQLEEKLKSSAAEHEKDISELTIKISEKQPEVEQQIENKNKLEVERD